MRIIPTLKAQHRFSGIVQTADSKLPLKGVVINIPDIKIAAVSDSIGNYNFENIPQGIYLVEISILGYTNRIERVIIKGSIKINYLMTASVKELKEVIVTGVIAATEKRKTPFSITTMDYNELVQHSSTNVIDAISKVPGVSAITDGQSISKPVIRGLGYNRVLTINDGVQQVDQVWFDEFGIEADANAVNKFEILKGPASLAYGSDAIAGVVNLIPEQPLAEGETKGDILLNYQTNNGLINNMLHLAGTKKGISWSGRIDNTMAHAYQNPNDGYVLNSQFNNFNTDATLGLHRKWGYTQIHASYFDMHTGIVDGTRDSATGIMERHVAYPDLNGGAATYELPTRQEQISYTPFVINQQIQHTKFVWDNSIAVGKARITAIFSWQKNQRRESNDPTIANTPNIYYSSNAATYDVRYISPLINGFSISNGINGVYQSSKSLGTLLLIPNYNLFEIGGFTIANKTMGKLTLSGGIRYNTSTFNGSDHWVDSATQAPAKQNGVNAFHEFTGFMSPFKGMSFSIGGTYDVAKNMFVKVNIARGWRAPNVAECAANGVHDGTVVYEIGENKLTPETSLEEDVAVGVNSKDVSFEMDIFNNNLNNYIYAKGLQSIFGGDSINNSLNAAGLGQAPVYKYTQGKARLSGGEITFNLHPATTPWVEFSSSLSVVYGTVSNAPDSTKYLPFVPPTRITAEFKFPVKKMGRNITNAYLKAGMLSCFQQKDIYQQYAIYNGLNTAVTPYEYAASRSATKGYALFNVGAGGDIMLKEKAVCKVYLLCNNFLNTGYMDYMSRFKYYPVNDATKRVGVFNMGRNISIKILIPIEFTHR